MMLTFPRVCGAKTAQQARENSTKRQRYAVLWTALQELLRRRAQI